MVLAAFVYYVNNKMTSVVEISFVHESLNFDFEKSGTSQRGRSSKNRFKIYHGSRGWVL